MFRVTMLVSWNRNENMQVKWGLVFQCISSSNPHAAHMGVRRNFCNAGSEVDILLIPFRLLAMQRKWT